MSPNTRPPCLPSVHRRERVRAQRAGEGKPHRRISFADTGAAAPLPLTLPLASRAGPSLSLRERGFEEIPRDLYRFGEADALHLDAGREGAAQAGRQGRIELHEPPGVRGPG